MEFLDNFVLPQSAEHIHLLHYMLIIILFLFIPFASILFGGTVLSIYYRRKALKSNDRNSLRFAKQIMEIITINKSVGFILGIVPLITAILIYSQLLHTSEITNLNYLAISLVLFIISLVLIYSYRYSLSFNEIFTTIGTQKDSEISNDISKFHDESLRISKRAGRYGSIFLFTALWFFITGVSVPAFYTSWEAGSFLTNLFDWKIISRFIYYILAAFALAGGMILFNFYELNNDKKYFEPEYLRFVRQKTIMVALTSAILLPVFMLINLLAIPGTSLSGAVFVYLVIALFLLFFGYHFMFLMLKKESRTMAAILFLVLIFSVGANIISDQLVMSNATKIHTAKLGENFEKILSELKGTGTVVELSGEEIYKVRCESCHQFDQKLVGPPHIDVLPKYVGKEAQLIAFIRNPVKVDPAYPQMPNPGLKPKEAQAVAKYLLETYNEKK